MPTTQRLEREGITIEMTGVISIYHQLERSFARLRPPASTPPDNEWARFQDEGRLMSGIEILEGRTKKGKTTITSAIEHLGKRRVGKVFRLDMAVIGETFVVGSGFGRSESREREEIPQRPPDPGVEYVPQPARTSSLTYLDLVLLGDVVHEVTEHPSDFTYTFQPNEGTTNPEVEFDLEPVTVVSDQFPF